MKSSLSIWHLLNNVKSTVKILSNFGAFLENINFNSLSYPRSPLFFRPTKFKENWIIIYLLCGKYFGQSDFVAFA